MIKITKENGEVVLCDRLLGVAFKSGGQVQHIAEGSVDLVDILYVKDSMQQHEINTMNAELQRRAAQGSDSNIVVTNRMPPQ